MISCEHAQNLFEAYLNDEVSASLVAELDAHCLNCSDCRQQLRLLEACGNVVRLDTSEPAVSGDFTDRLVKILEEDHIVSTARAGGMQINRRTRVAGALVGLAAALGLSVILPLNNADNSRVPEVLSAQSERGGASVSESLLRGFLGVPIPLLKMVEGITDAVELGGITASQMNDAAAAESPSIQLVPIVPQPAHDGPDVLDTLPPFEDDDGELL